MRCVALYFIAFAVIPVAGLIADTNELREVAQNPASADGSSDASGKSKSKSSRVLGFTLEREAAAKAFVEQHHAELAQLLLHLKENNPKEYEKAVRDLFRASERLALAHEKDVERYEIELKAWQVQSKIDLLTARYHMNPTAELKEQLQRAIVAQVDLRKALLTLERRRVRERLEKFDEQLQALEKSRNESVERQLRSLLGTNATTTTPNPALTSAAVDNAKTNATTKNPTPPNPTSKPSERPDKPTSRNKDKTTK